jgi:hypothetical protein
LGESWPEASPDQKKKKKFMRPYVNQWPSVVVRACHSSYNGKPNRRTEVQTGPRGKEVGDKVK